MAASTSISARVPLEVYLRTTYQPDCDWIDGEVRERNMGERPHSVVQKFFTMFLGLREQEWGVLVWPEHRVQVAATRFRIPDVCLTLADEPFEEIIRTPPLLCIEVLSSEDRIARMQERVDDYFVMGVQTVWVVDPWARGIFSASHGDPLRPVVDALLVPGTAIRVPLAEVFRELDRLQRA